MVTRNPFIDPIEAPDLATKIVAKDGSDDAGYVTIGDLLAVPFEQMAYVLAEQYRGASDQATLVAALAAGATAGKPVWLESGRTYNVTSRLSLSANTGLVSDGTAIIAATATDFTSTTSVSGSSTATNNVIYAESVANVRIEGIKIEFTAVQNSWVNLIDCYNCTRPVIRWCDLSGLCRGYLIAIDQCTDAEISYNKLHSSEIDATSNGQLTAIAIGDAGDIVSDCAIHHNTIRDLTETAAFRLSFGDQVDGINLVGETERISVTDNFIQNVGEGIDMFARHCVVSGNILLDCYQFGIKLMHGAQYNSIQNNVIIDTGLAGVVITGSDGATHHTECNNISHNIISGIDPDGNWAGSNTACILTSADLIYKAKNNTFAHNILNPGTLGKYCIIRQGSSVNHFLYNSFIGPGTEGIVYNISEPGRFIALGLRADCANQVTYYTDFLGDALEDELLAGVGSGAGNAVALSPGAGGRVQLTTSSTDTTHANNGVSIGLGALDWRADQGGLVMEARLQVSAITDVMLFIGFTDALGSTVEAPLYMLVEDFDSDADDACGVVFDTDASFDEFVHGGVKATADTGVVYGGAGPIAATYFTVRVEVSPTGAVTSYVNEIALATVANAVTATAPLVPIIFAQNRGAAARTVLVDYLWVQANRQPRY